MGGKTIATSETKAEALKLQSSAYGVTIPWAFGVVRGACNLVGYYDFTAIAKTTEENAGGKGGVTVSSTTYTYTVSPIIALAHGVISGVKRKLNANNS
jgi:hypothetical protein